MPNQLDSGRIVIKFNTVTDNATIRVTVQALLVREPPPSSRFALWAAWAEGSQAAMGSRDGGIWRRRCASLACTR